MGKGLSNMNNEIDMQHIYECMRIAMMLLEMGSEVEENPFFASYGNENDYIWAAHSYIQYAGTYNHSDSRAVEMYSKITADAAIENWQCMAKNSDAGA